MDILVSYTLTDATHPPFPLCIFVFTFASGNIVTPGHQHLDCPSWLLYWEGRFESVLQRVGPLKDSSNHEDTATMSHNRLMSCLHTQYHISVAALLGKHCFLFKSLFCSLNRTRRTTTKTRLFFASRLRGRYSRTYDYLLQHLWERRDIIKKGSALSSEKISWFPRPFGANPWFSGRGEEASAVSNRFWPPCLFNRSPLSQVVCFNPC